MRENTVIVGMSGGVDSSVAAYLLKKQGYQVIGVTMIMWDGCHGLHENELKVSTEVIDAKKVATQLDIPHYVLDFRKDFQKEVIDYFVKDYFQGKTPNPCIQCNRQIKWSALLKKADELGAQYIATGHYANINQLENGRYTICNSKTAQKDQTYVLYQLTQEQLKRTLMPIGNYEKQEIRNIALELGLDIATKKDSQDICFIPDNDYVNFLKKEAPDWKEEMGDFVLSDGSVVGKHKGISNYTIGQRKGLGIALGEPVFVNAILCEKNQVVVGSNEEVFRQELIAGELNTMAVEQLAEGQRYLAKIRYSDPGTLCEIKMLQEGKMKLEFEKPVRAVTPGQAVVLYQGDNVAGGGIILG